VPDLHFEEAQKSMTSRQARNARREAERKAKKLESKKARLAGTSQPATDTAPAIQPRWNPELEDEFPREVQIRTNALADRLWLEAGLKPQPAPRTPEQLQERAREHSLSPRQPHPPVHEIGFVSQNAAPQSARRAQINRENAANSTGPRTTSGKLASSRNSLKHGLASGQPIIPGEDPAAFETLVRTLTEEHQPATATEQLLLQDMARSYWLTQRAVRLQNDCFTESDIDEKRLALFLRYQTTHERSFYKALSNLRALQKTRLANQRGFVSHTTAETHQLVPQTPLEDGFVSHNAPQTGTHPEFVRQNPPSPPNGMAQEALPATRCE